MHATRRILTTALACLALAACGGGDGPAADDGPLTMADAERAGFVRGDPKDFAYIGAIDGASGTMGGGNVELYVYEGEVPADRLEGLRATAIPAFGWNGFCHVRNITMVYENEAACEALRELD